MRVEIKEGIDVSPPPDLVCPSSAFCNIKTNEQGETVLEIVFVRSSRLGYFNIDKFCRDIADPSFRTSCIGNYVDPPGTAETYHLDGLMRADLSRGFSISAKLDQQDLREIEGANVVIENKETGETRSVPIQKFLESVNSHIEEGPQITDSVKEYLSDITPVAATTFGFALFIAYIGYLFGEDQIKRAIRGQMAENEAEAQDHERAAISEFKKAEKIREGRK